MALLKEWQWTAQITITVCHEVHMPLTATEWKLLSANDKKNIGKKDCFISEDLWGHYTETVKPVSWKEIEHISSAWELVAFYASSSEEMFKLSLLSMASIVCSISFHDTGWTIPV
jgi:hypothetical protein